MKKALFTTTDKKFFPGARALMESAKRHHPDVERWCMVPEADFKEAEQALGDIAKIVLPPRRIEGVPDRMQVIVQKLFAAQIPADVVAYVDSDAFFCRPAPELWEVERGKINVVIDNAKSIVSMVKGPDILRERFLRQFPEVSMKRGFNSGVWAFYPEDFPDIPERFERALAEGGYEIYDPIFDQPLLNGLLFDKVRWLSFKFNVSSLFDNHIPADARIVHFTGGVCKPWDPRYPRHEPQYYYWLRHGLNETCKGKLLAAKLRILLVTPKRLIGPRIKRWLKKR